MTGENGNLLLQSFDSGEKLEDHEKDEDEASQDDGINISLDTNNTGEYVGPSREENNSNHPAPDDETDGKLEERLVILALEKIADALVEHKTSQKEDDDLVELETACVHRCDLRKLCAR